MPVTSGFGAARTPSLDTPAQKQATAEGRVDARPMLVLADAGDAACRRVASVATACAEAGLHVAVVGPAAAQQAFRFDELGADFHTVELAGPPHRAVKALVVATAYHRATVVHAHGFRAGAVAVLAGRLAARARRRGAGRRPLLVTRYPEDRKRTLTGLVAGRADRTLPSSAPADAASAQELTDLYRTFGSG